MPLVVSLGTNSAGREPSPEIWDRISLSDVWHGKAFLFHEDFKGFGLTTAVSSNVGLYSGQHHWRSYEDTGDAITQLATDEDGVCAIAIAATNNNESWISPGSATAVLCRPRTPANDGRSIFFEARVNMSTLVGNMFVGLTEEGLAAADTIADSAGTLADKDYIGFLVDEDAPTVARFVASKEGGTAVNISSSVNTFVADTFVKLGFVIDMQERDTNKRVKFYVNGVEQGSYMTNAQYIDTTHFCTDQELTILFGGKNNNAAKTVRADWIRMGTLYTPSN